MSLRILRPPTIDENAEAGSQQGRSGMDSGIIRDDADVHGALAGRKAAIRIDEGGRVSDGHQGVRLHDRKAGLGCAGGQAAVGFDRSDHIAELDVRLADAFEDLHFEAPVHAPAPFSM